MKYRQKQSTLTQAAAKAGMDRKTAGKYLQSGKLPSQMKKPHTWRTRQDPFEEVWEEVKEKLGDNPGFEALTLFEYLQRKYPGKFSDGQLRTLQRRIKVWRATEGPGREVFFSQKHIPGELCQSDFTDMSKMRITICSQPFSHLLYHFVLTYSNWETMTICFSESYESLCEGLQNALWELGSVPKAHQSDRMTAAVKSVGSAADFTQRYRALLRHYGMEPRMIQTARPNENGDVEQRHYRFRRALEQALLLRGSRDFSSRGEYEDFLQKLLRQLNSGRQQRFDEELKVMRLLPQMRLDDYRTLDMKVGPSSTIHVAHNTYSVHSRLIGEKIKIRLYADHLEVWYAQRLMEKMPRLRGEGGHRIQYRHIIDCLVRKPGAFENFRYRSDLFPTSRFRMAYDLLRESFPSSGHKHYLKILHLAATENETRVDDALRLLMSKHRSVTFEAVKEIVESSEKIPPVTDIVIDEINPGIYDELLEVTG